MLLSPNRLAGLTMLLGTVFFAPTALAHSAHGCPEDKVLTKPREIADVKEKLMKRETLAEVKLEGWRKVGNLLLRMRRITVQPGGLVPTHYHDDRPSIVYVLSGEIIEHSTFCAVPIIHKTEAYTPEFADFHGHWWENKGSVPAVVISADVIPPEYRDTMD